MMATLTFTCEDCKATVHRAFDDGVEARMPVCFNCQWLRRHPEAPSSVRNMLLRVAKACHLGDNE